MGTSTLAPATEDRAWYSEDGDAVVAALQTSADNGLTSAEVESRLREVRRQRDRL